MIEFVELTKLADKKKWQLRFQKAYTGELREQHDGMFGKNVRFFVAVEGTTELGYVRINDKTEHFKEFTNEEVWNLTDAYVKPPYRSKGVLKSLIEYVVANHKVKMMYCETERFNSNAPYYFLRGFTRHYTVQNGAMTWAFQTEFFPIVERHNASREN